MIRGLPVYILEQDIIDTILTHALEPKEVRLIRKKDTGESRGFAFVEFESVEEATEWLEAEQGTLQFGTWLITMQYSQVKDVDENKLISKAKMLVDWKCAKCDTQNFKRRDTCFKCGSKRPLVDVSNTLLEDEGDESSPQPTNVLMLTNLDPLTLEDTILEKLTNFSYQQIQKITINRDKQTNMSRGKCYVEMLSVVDAMILVGKLIEDPISIDGRRLIVAYKKVDPAEETKPEVKEEVAEEVEEEEEATEKKYEKGLQAFTDDEIMKMAEFSADLYAKHPAERASYVEYYCKYYREGGDPTPALKAIYGEKVVKSDETTAAAAVTVDLGKVVVDGVEYKKYPTPNTSTYQFDKTSGYYYDPISTLYYDATSQYYYNSHTSSFCYWDATHETFLPAPDATNTKTEGEEGKKEKGKDKEKVKSAKKVQKDMEKWAKMLNKKKNININQITAPSAPAPEVVPLVKGVEDVAFSILTQRAEKPRGLPTGASEEIDQQALLLTDWDKFACLLCKRQFQTKDKLMKHNTVSDLHKQNLNTWKQQQMESRLSGSSGSLESALQYRDRAKERRVKFGPDDVPPPNKFKEKYMKAMDNVAASIAPDTSNQKIDDSNVGNKMLQKMGWKEGLGLGKSNQGRTDIISTDDDSQRTRQSGLGTAQVAGRRSNDDYRLAAKKTLWSRFNDQR